MKRRFTIPLVLAVLTMAGLISALLGDGVWDALSWVALGIPPALGGYHALRSRRPGRG